MAQLEIASRDKEGVKILDLSGKLTVGGASDLREKVNAETAGGSLQQLLNLKDVEYIDSTGLGALVVCVTGLRRIEGNMKLLNLNRRNIDLLVMTKLDTVFEVFTDEQDAVSSYYPDRKIKAFDILNFVQQMKKEA